MPHIRVYRPSAHAALTVSGNPVAKGIVGLIMVQV